MSNFADLLAGVKSATVLVLARTGMQELPEIGEFIRTSDNAVLSKGTGFCVDQSGSIITASHVIPNNSAGIDVCFATAPEISYSALLASRDEDGDVCIIKIDKDKNKFPFLKLGNFNDCREGDDVGFIGFPLRFDFPITHKGIISGKTRISYEEGLNSVPVLTVNAFINPGNSGGPVFHGDTGEILAVVNAKPNLPNKNMLLRLPPDYSPAMTIGGVDPLTLTVDTYNRTIKHIGEVSQIGMGFCSSIELAKALL